MVFPVVPRLAWQLGPSLTLAHPTVSRGVHYDPGWGGAQAREELLHSVRVNYVLYLMALQAGRTAQQALQIPFSLLVGSLPHTCPSLMAASNFMAGVGCCNYSFLFLLLMP